MPAYDNAYSRLVAAAKIALPLLALAILSTLFLVSRRVDIDRTIPYAEVDVNELAREQRVGAPRYSTVTADGSAITVTAVSARPDGGALDRLSATGLSAEIETTDGRTIAITAETGVLDTGGQTAMLAGTVRIATSDGWTVTTDELDAALDRTRITSPGTVSATGPLGTLTAGSMTLGADAPGAEVLVFSGGVSLLYIPQQ